MNDHKYLAQIADNGEIYVRDKNGESGLLKLEGSALLNFSFEGKSSTGENCAHQFQRPLYRGDRSYKDNEIMRYLIDLMLDCSAEKICA